MLSNTRDRINRKLKDDQKHNMDTYMRSSFRKQRPTILQIPKQPSWGVRQLNSSISSTQKPQHYHNSQRARTKGAQTQGRKVSWGTVSNICIYSRLFSTPQDYQDIAYGHRTATKTYNSNCGQLIIKKVTLQNGYCKGRKTAWRQ